MKRDWTIIRLVLLDEPRGSIAKRVWVEHQALCMDAGYVNLTAVIAYGEDMYFLKTGEPYLTLKGIEAADRLKNLPHLCSVLARLDSLGIGDSSDLVFELLDQKAREALNG